MFGLRAKHWLFGILAVLLLTASAVTPTVSGAYKSRLLGAQHQSGEQTGPVQTTSGNGSASLLLSASQNDKSMPRAGTPGALRAMSGIFPRPCGSAALPTDAQNQADLEFKTAHSGRAPPSVSFL